MKKVTLKLALTLFSDHKISQDEEIVVGIKTNKARALLAYLALEADRSHRITSHCANPSYAPITITASITDSTKTHAIHSSSTASMNACTSIPFASAIVTSTKAIRVIAF